MGRTPPLVLIAVLLGLPQAPSPEGARDPGRGKPLYQEHCAKCHGVNGDGRGSAGRGLDPKPTDFRAAKVDDAYWFEITKLGSKAVGKSDTMEGYGKILSDDQIRDVLAYCKTFKQSGGGR